MALQFKCDKCEKIITEEKDTQFIALKMQNGEGEQRRALGGELCGECAMKLVLYFQKYILWELYSDPSDSPPDEPAKPI